VREFRRTFRVRGRVLGALDKVVHSIAVLQHGFDGVRVVVLQCDCSRRRLLCSNCKHTALIGLAMLE